MADLNPGASRISGARSRRRPSAHPRSSQRLRRRQRPAAIRTSYQPATEYIEDTQMYSIMSYNSAILTGFDSNDPDNPYGVVQTPRTHDIYVMQQLYGVNCPDTRALNSTYGYNASGVGEFYGLHQLWRRGRTRPRPAHDLGRRRRRLARSVRRCIRRDARPAGLRPARSPARTA